jgi:hypothetical protein
LRGRETIVLSGVEEYMRRLRDDLREASEE